MKIYLASRFGRQTEMLQYKYELEHFGHEITSKWLTHEPEDGAITNDLKKEWAMRNIVDVRRADAMIVFTEASHVWPRIELIELRATQRLPGHPWTPGYGGHWFEFGLAWALNKKMFMVGPRDGLFGWSSGVSWFETWIEFLAYGLGEIHEAVR